MDPRARVRAGYNHIAPAYLVHRSEDSADVRLLQQLIDRLPVGARVLDAGCGAGVPVTRRLSRHFRVTGVDFSEAQLALARRLVPEARFLQADLTELPFCDGAFDAICSYYAIIHIPRTQHAAVLSAFHRLLKPGGLALICLGAGDLEDGVEEDWLGAPMYWSHFDRETNMRLVQGSGLRILGDHLIADAIDPRAVHLFVLAEKPVETDSTG